MQYLVSCCGILASLAVSISSVVLGRAKRVLGTEWWEWLIVEFECVRIQWGVARGRGKDNIH